MAAVSEQWQATTWWTLSLPPVVGAVLDRGDCHQPLDAAWSVCEVHRVSVYLSVEHGVIRDTLVEQLNTQHIHPGGGGGGGGVEFVDYLMVFANSYTKTTTTTTTKKQMGGIIQVEIVIIKFL